MLVGILAGVRARLCCLGLCNLVEVICHTGWCTSLLRACLCHLSFCDLVEVSVVPVVIVAGVIECFLCLGICRGHLWCRLAYQVVGV